MKHSNLRSVLSLLSFSLLLASCGLWGDGLNDEAPASAKANTSTSSTTAAHTQQDDQLQAQWWFWPKIRVTGKSAVQQFDEYYGEARNYDKFIVVNGNSLPAYYDLTVRGKHSVVLCGGRGVSVEKIASNDFPNRYRVRLQKRGETHIKAYAGTSCPKYPYYARVLWRQNLIGLAPLSYGEVATDGSAAVYADLQDRVFAWGNNTDGLLGLGIKPPSFSESQQKTPLAVKLSKDGAQLSGITRVATTSGALAALSKTGQVYSWGNGYTGHTSPQLEYPQAISQLSDIVQIEAGANHFLALKNDGTLFGWGQDRRMLNIGNFDMEQTTPIAVKDAANLLTDLVQVSAGSGYNLALRADGTVVAWGENSSGQIGDGTQVDWSDVSTFANGYKATPVLVKNAAGTAPLTDVFSIAAGQNHSLAITNNGQVLGWGSNNSSALGAGTNQNQHALPITIQGLHNIARISAGSNNSAAINHYGEVLMWGSNNDGVLGYGAFPDYITGKDSKRATPAIVGGTYIDSITAISLSGGNALAYSSNDVVYSWGGNFWGQLGDGSTTRKSSPVVVNIPY